MSVIAMQGEALIKIITDKLVGRKITGVCTVSDKSSVGFNLDNGQIVWIDCDPEGNGMGWLSVQGKSKK